MVEETETSNFDKVSSYMGISNTPSEEAAQNIERASFYDIDPDSYQELKPNLETEVSNIERIPAQVGDVTADFATQNTQVASAVKDDISWFDAAEKRVEHYGYELTEAPVKRREINELQRKWMDEGLSEGEQEYLNDLNTEMAEKEAGKPKDIGTVENILVQGVSGAGDIVRSYTENLAMGAGIVAASTGAYAALGTLIPIPGVGTGIGATAGFAQGVVLASSTVGAVDAYEQTRGSVINSLRSARGKDGKPLSLDKDKIGNVSLGVSLISGAIGAIPFAKFASGNPIVKQFASPKLIGKLMSGSPKLIARMELLGSIMSGSLTEGIEEGAQEFIQIVGDKFAAIDDSEESFINTLDNILEAAGESLNIDTLKQVATAGATGIVAGGTFQGVTSIPGQRGFEKRLNQFKELETKRRASLDDANVMLGVANEMQNTKMKDMAKPEMNKFLNKLFEVSGMEDVYFTREDLQSFAGEDVERQAAISKLNLSELDGLGEGLNQPVQVSRADVISELIMDYPEVADHMRTSPESMSPFEAKEGSKEFVTKLENADKERQSIFDSLGSDEQLSPEAETQLAKISEDVEASLPFDSEFEYLDSVAFVETEGILTKEEAEVFNTARLDAQLETARQVKQEFDEKFDKIDNRIIRDVKGKEKQQKLKENEQGFSLITSFKDTKNKSEAAMSVTLNHSRKGFSPSAIDPDTLPAELKDVYLADKNLKKRKVFVKGGIDLEESAVLNGVETGEELLRLLINTPNRSEVVKTNIQDNIKTRNRVEQNTKESRKLHRDKAFNNENKLILKEMEFMRTNKWSTVKRGIIKISSRVPSIKSIQDNATAILGSTKIKDVNPNRFLQGSNKSKRLALQTFLDGKFEQSFVHKEKSVINNEMRRQAINIKENVDRNKTFWKNVNKSKSVQQSLKDAGYSKVMEDFSALFRLDGKNTNVKEQNAFTKFIKRKAQEGDWSPTVPERLDNTQMTVNEMTADQYQEISDAGRYIVQQAKLKNKLRKAQEGREEFETAERLKVTVEEAAKSNINFDENKLKDVEGRNEAVLAGLKKSVDSGISTIASLKSITEELDEFKPNGTFHNLISKPLKDAETQKRFKIKEIADTDKIVIEKFYGKDGFERLVNTFVDVPEFEGMQQLGLQNGKGTIRKSDLLVMFAYKGDPDGQQRLQNFKTKEGVNLTLAQIQVVLDRELTGKDAAFAQAYLVNGFKQFGEESKALHERTTGAEVHLVEGVENHHNGKVLPGGYFPIRLRMKSADTLAQRAFEEASKVSKDVIEFGKDALSDKESEMFAKLRSAEMTKQGRNKERTGTDRTLSLDIFNLMSFKEEIVHDLSFREAGIDVLKILKDKDNASNMTAVVGRTKYGTLVNHVKDVISKEGNAKTSLFSDQNQFLNGVIDSAHKVQAVSVIGYNYTSALIQPVSLGNVAIRYGARSGVYMAKHAAKMAANPAQYPLMAEIASKINPDIQLEQDGIDDTVTKNQFDFLPSSSTFLKDYNSSSAQAINRIKKTSDKVLVEHGFAALREIDKANRVLVTMAMSEMFLNGHVEGYSLKRVQAMSETERNETNQSIVQQASDLSLTASSRADRSSIEKNEAVKTYVRFFTDRRAGFNTAMAAFGKAKSTIKRGDYKKASLMTLNTFLVSGAMQAWVGMVRDEEENIVKGLKGVKDGETFVDFLQDTTRQVVRSPIEMLAENTPFLDSAFYQTKVKRRTDYRTVSNPFESVLSNISMTYNALNDLIEGENLSKVDKKAIFTTLGYSRGGAPTNAMWKAYETLNESETLDKTGKYLGSVIQDLKNNIASYISDNEDNPEAETFISDLIEVRNSLPQDEKSIEQLIPEESQETLKEVLSQGDWLKVNKETGAVGTYQFTKERWEEISGLEPDLGLTDEGRVSKSQAQQEKAMEWSINNNAQALNSYEIPVNNENLLGAHMFGLDNYTAIYHNSGGLKLSKALGEEAKQPEFKDFKTVKDVKAFLKSKIN